MEETLNKVTNILKFCDFDVYALLDSKANLYFVIQFLTNGFHVFCKVLNEPFEVYTTIEESMVDFDIILEMDWLYDSYASIDCLTRKVKL